MASTMRAPVVVPAGWELLSYSSGGESIFKQTLTGLRAIFSIDRLEEGYEDLPSEGPGMYRHISLSRADRYPGWDEMRDFIYGCGLFDHSYDVVMYLPPPERYVNLHPNTFHFYQKVRR